MVSQIILHCINVGESYAILILARPEDILLSKL